MRINSAPVHRPPEHEIGDGCPLPRNHVTAVNAHHLTTACVTYLRCREMIAKLIKIAFQSNRIHKHACCLFAAMTLTLTR